MTLATDLFFIHFIKYVSSFIQKNFAYFYLFTIVLHVIIHEIVNWNRFTKYFLLKRKVAEE